MWNTSNTYKYNYFHISVRFAICIRLWIVTSFDLKRLTEINEENGTLKCGKSFLLEYERRNRLLVDGGIHLHSPLVENVKSAAPCAEMLAIKSYANNVTIWSVLRDKICKASIQWNDCFFLQMFTIVVAKPL